MWPWATLTADAISLSDMNKIINKVLNQELDMIKSIYFNVIALHNRITRMQSFCLAIGCRRWTSGPTLHQQLLFFFMQIVIM